MIKKLGVYYLFLVILFVYHSPFLILGKDTYIPPTADNLDELVMFTIITPENLMCSNREIINQILLGVPRFSFPSELNYLTILFNYFDPFWVWCFNSYFMAFVAFFGSILLLQDYVLPLSYKLLGYETRICNYTKLLIGICSLYFALLPHWMFGGLSIAGQPLLLWALLNITINQKSYLSWIIVILFPFFSNFIFSDIFYFTSLAIIGIIYQIARKQFLLKWNLAILVLFLLSLLIQYRLILNEIFYHIPTQRISVRGGEIRKGLTFFQHIKETLLIFNENKFQFFTYFRRSFSRTDALIITIVWIIFLLYLFIKRNRKLVIINLLIVLVPYIVITLTTNSGLIKTFFATLFPSLETTIASFTIRLYNVSSLCWLIIYFVLLSSIYMQTRKITYAVLIFLCNTIYQIAFIPEINDTNNTFANNIVYKFKPTYQEYFDDTLFNEIKLFIQNKYNLSPPNYRVLTITENYFLPSILLFNGFYTVDGYLPYYPTTTYSKLEELFSGYKICGTPINFSTKVYFTLCSNNLFPVDNSILKKYNCKFVFSINPSIQSKSLVKLKGFKGKFWTVYLYQVI